MARLIQSFRDRMVVDEDSHTARVDVSDRIPGLELSASVISSGDWRAIAKHGGSSFVTSGYTDPETAMASAFAGMVGAA